MPLYDYKCLACEKVFEVEQTYDEHDRDVEHEQTRAIRCPHCGSKRVEHSIASSVLVITSKKS
jgi:putative FmdB family regulatory protein